jgi:hypothetical protein
MNSRFHRLVAALSLATAGLAACADDAARPSSAAEVRARVDKLVPALQRRASDVSAAELPAFADALSAAQVATTPPTGEAPATEASPDVPLYLSRWWISQTGPQDIAGVGMLRTAPVHTPPQRPATPHAPVDAASWLDHNILTDEDYVGAGEFRIPSGLVCNGDPSCMKSVAEQRYGIIATAIGDDGLELDVVSGPDRAVAATFVLSPDGDDLSLDLASLGGLLGARGTTAAGAVDLALHDLPIDGDVGATISFPQGLRVQSGDLAIDVAPAIDAIQIQLHHGVVTTTTKLGHLRLDLRAADKTPGKLELPSLGYRAESSDGESIVHGFSIGKGPVDLRVDDEADTGARVITSAAALTLGEVDGSKMKLDPDSKGEAVIRIDAGQLQLLAGQLRTE